MQVLDFSPVKTLKIRMKPNFTNDNKQMQYYSGRKRTNRCVIKQSPPAFFSSQKYSEFQGFRSWVAR
jgi:hypothetical protein